MPTLRELLVRRIEEVVDAPMPDDLNCESLCEQIVDVVFDMLKIPSYVQDMEQDRLLSYQIEVLSTKH